jgi:hypothetical protein
MSFIIQEIPQPAVFGINTTEPTGAGGAITFEVGTQDELFFEGNASANFSLNVTYDPTTSLDVAMQNDDIVNISLKVKNGSIPYALTEIKVDGTASGLSIAFANDEFLPLTGVTGDIANYDLQITKRQTNTFDIFVGKSDQYSNLLTIPNIPTIGSANLGATVSSISVAFTPASSGSVALGFEALSTPSAITATGSASPITVTGLTQGTSYTFQVRARNEAGFSGYSSPSNSKAPGAAASQQAYTTAGTFSWVAPTGVTSVSVVAVGGGGGAGAFTGGGGGALAYKNSISVTPGTSYAVIVGAAGGFSRFTAAFGSMTAGAGVGGGAGGAGGTPSGVYDGGGNGGNAASGTGGVMAVRPGGGGAAGYSGNGGNGATGANNGSNGVGGGAGGGAGVFNSDGAGGGGVGILGEGSNGTGGTYNTNVQGGGGSGGSGGAVSSNGALFGGGGGGNSGPVGASGAVRIIWSGNSGITRAFPSTNTGDL